MLFGAKEAVYPKTLFSEGVERFTVKHVCIGTLQGHNASVSSPNFYALLV